MGVPRLSRGINTAIETAGNAPWEFFHQVPEHVDTVLHDHKLTDRERHKQWVGTDNARIKTNYQRAYETFSGQNLYRPYSCYSRR